MVTRRGFFVTIGVLAGGLVLDRVHGGLVATARSFGLAPSRAATYHRLVGALQAAPDRRWRHRDVASATRAFARWYARQPVSTRNHVDVVLDALPAVGPVRHEELASATRPPNSSRQAHRCAVVAAALQLAATACDPPLETDDHPLVASLR